MKAAVQLGFLGYAAAVVAAGDKTPFDWEAITPNRDLEYHDCHGEFKCARLEVPLDWLNKTDTRTAVIAIAKLPAVVSDDDPSFAGSILSNPGGPGGAGVSFLTGYGRYLQLYADKPGRRHHEIVSFDPRGIGHTTPSVDCFRSNALARDAWMLEDRGLGGLDLNDRSIAYGNALTKAVAQRCVASEEEWGEAMAYVNTPSVARDMVEIIDKIDKLRRREAAERSGDESRLELRKRNDDDGDVPRLQYIGFSYGTVLGNYFASLFPGRVGRLVLNGVVDSDDYATGTGWLTSLTDTDKLLKEFFKGCHAAGQPACALARSSDASASEPESRFWSWIADLDNTPLSVISPSGTTVIITGSDVRALTFSGLYKPLQFFQVLADTFNEAMIGNTTALVERVADENLPHLEDSCSVGNSSSAEVFLLSEASSAVSCSDGDDLRGRDVAWWRKYIDFEINMSKLAGSFGASGRFACSNWPVRPNWSFKGPFTTPKPDPSLSSDKPAAPLLFLSSRFDPVTPLSSARAMRASHPGAGLVLQESLGHSAIFTAPSNCSRKIVADYFEFGTVPAEETVCETECGPWDEGCSVFDWLSDGSGSVSAASLHAPEDRLRMRRFMLGEA